MIKSGVTDLEIQKLASYPQDSFVSKTSKKKRLLSSSIQDSNRMYQAAIDASSGEFIAPVTAKFYEANVSFCFDSQIRKIWQRIYYQRKASKSQQQVLVIFFDGVVGHVNFQQSYPGSENYGLSLRKEALAGLKVLSQNFQIVLYSQYSSTVILKILKLLSNEAVDIQAFYRFLEIEGSSSRFFDYS